MTILESSFHTKIDASRDQNRCQDQFRYRTSLDDVKPVNPSFFLSFDTMSINFNHHLRCGGWLKFEFSKREKHSGWTIKTIYKKLRRGMLKHIPLH